MKPSAFDILRPHSVAEAIELLSASAGDASIVAGSQSLGPMLNLRLVRPRLLIDVTGISEMTKVEEDDKGVTVGACVTTASIEDGKLPCKGLTMLPAIAANIAYRAVRNRGTIGGSVCHADPAADWPVALCGLSASCIIAGPQGRRSLPVDEFIVGAFETMLDDDEILVAESGAALRLPDFARLRAGQFCDDKFHFLRRQELAFLDIDHATRGGGGHE